MSAPEKAVKDLDREASFQLNKKSPGGENARAFAVEAAGAQVTTLEGLMDGEKLGPVQQAFVEEDAMQCGYCTSGQVVAVEALLRQTPAPTLDQIREGVSGNLCRCGAYAYIFKAAQRAAQLKAGR